jgi:hypothetical protein
VWDTAGQERFRSITRAYYRGSRGLLVIYDITTRSSWENAKYWVEEARSLVDHVDMMPFILGRLQSFPSPVTVTVSLPTKHRCVCGVVWCGVVCCVVLCCVVLCCVVLCGVV